MSRSRSYGKTDRGTTNIAPPYVPTGREDPKVSKHIVQARAKVDETLGIKTAGGTVSKPHKTEAELAAAKKRTTKRKLRPKDSCTQEELLNSFACSVKPNPMDPKILRDHYKRGPVEE